VGGSDGNWKRQRRIKLGYALGFTALVVGVGLVIALVLRADHDLEEAKLVLTASVTLLSAGLFAGILKSLLDGVALVQKRKDETFAFVSHVLGEIKAVHDRVDRARIVLSAHKSVKTYGEEIRALIESLVRLRNVTRSLGTAYDVTAETRTATTTAADSMKRYLKSLIDEFGANYLTFSLAQSIYEEKKKKAIEAYVAKPTEVPPPTGEDSPWEALKKACDVLCDLIAFERKTNKGPKFRDEFDLPHDAATKLLVAEQNYILERTDITPR
jgi:hypothetical protein